MRFITVIDNDKIGCKYRRYFVL